jgi:SAM-dependent methyltransferase
MSPLSGDPAAVVHRVRQEAMRHMAHYAHILDRTHTALDVGVGPGMTARMICDRFEQIDMLGLDVVDSMREGIPLVLYDGLKFSFEDKAFDTVLLQYTLHHSIDPMTVLKESARVCRRDLVIIEEFELAGSDHRVEERKEAEVLSALGLPPDMHHSGIQQQTLEAEFRRLSLTITASTPLSTCSTRRVEKRLYLLETP